MAATKPKLAALVTALLFAAGQAGAGNFTVVNTRSLAFGRFVAGAGGPITVNPDGTRTSGGGVILLPSTSTSAAFTLSDNQKNATCSVSLPADGAVTLSNGTSTMPLTAFKTNLGSTCVFSGGTVQLTVGVTMTVGPNQKPGNYSGNIPITVTFN